jgi:phosphoribosyl 1,2-cyclic phosphodiesterase
VNIDQPTKTNIDFTVKFWGVRGQVPTPGQETYRFGGNTPCLEMNVAGKLLIFDGGTGLRVLGNALLSQMPVEAHLFFTHANWDRIQGFPFFVPAFVPGNHFHIYGTETQEGKTFEDKLSKQMHGPNFPVPIQVMGAKLEFHPLEPCSSFVLDDVTIETILLHIDHQALGYRVSCQNFVAVYATDSDIEHPDNRAALQQIAKNADLLIINTPIAPLDHHDLDLWQPLLQFAQDIQVKQLLFSTHDPDCQDPHLESLERKLKAHYDMLKFAKEGEIITISG